jgi:hypothetical protein
MAAFPAMTHEGGCVCRYDLLAESLLTPALIYFIECHNIIVDVNLYFYWEKYAYISNVEIKRVVLLGTHKE